MGYDKHNIAALIEKFWDGESTLREEKVLEEYFLYSEHIPREFADAEQYFLVRSERSKKASLPADFEKNILAQIENDGNSKGKLVSLAFAWRAVAAIFILALTAGLWYQLQKDNPPNQIAGNQSTATDTYENPREAFEATKEALFMMSSKFNEGSSEMMNIKKLDQAQNKIKSTEK